MLFLRGRCKLADDDNSNIYTQKREERGETIMAGEGKTWRWATGFQKVGIKKERGSFILTKKKKKRKLYDYNNGGYFENCSEQIQGLSLLSCYSKDRVIRTIAIPH